MQLIYEEKEPKFRFRYWLNYQEIYSDMYRWMDVNEWLASQFGEIGHKWGWHREVTHLTNRICEPSTVSYSWRFQDKDDAMLFKLRWGGYV